jgi:hypothetical protein
MKSLINKFKKNKLLKFLANTELGFLLRNSLQVYPQSFKTPKKKYPISISDCFLWRTDKNYQTKFKYADLLNLFYKIENSWVEFHFYSKNNKLIKIRKIENLDLFNELVIDSKFFNNLEDYGVFYIYHFSMNSKIVEEDNVLVNRCYLGYSQNNNLFSFVHGNVYAKYTSILSNKKIEHNMMKMSFLMNENYTIQKYFDGFDQTELMFINPSSKTLKFKIEGKKYMLKAGCCRIIEIKQPVINILSNCRLLRPTVFSYKNGYLDVHHS